MTTLLIIDLSHILITYIYQDDSNSSSTSRTFPFGDLSALILPSGLTVKYSSIAQCPLSQFFSFVTTDDKGGHLYVSCLQFYELIDSEDVIKALSQIGVEDVVSKLTI